MHPELMYEETKQRLADFHREADMRRLAKSIRTPRQQRIVQRTQTLAGLLTAAAAGLAAVLLLI